MSFTRGGRNLVILGVCSVLFASVTTGVSLAMYRLSGDIYLDRSRPGYLPDEDEVKEETGTTSSFYFPETGELTPTDLDEYLRELNLVNNRLKAFSDPYSPLPLSDESLGIPSALEETPEI